jgi:hypothetical protein
MLESLHCLIDEGIVSDMPARHLTRVPQPLQKHKKEMESFLARPRIFATQTFFEMHEARARANLGAWRGPSGTARVPAGGPVVDRVAYPDRMVKLTIVSTSALLSQLEFVAIRLKPI